MRFDEFGHIEWTRSFPQLGGAAGEGFDGIYGVTVRGDGRIVISGDYAVGNGRTFGLARLLPDGGSDPTFGDGGITRPFLLSARDQNLCGHVVQPDAGVVACGESSDKWFLLARYLDNGALDPTFAPDGGRAGGGVSLNTSFVGVPSRLVLLPNEALLLVGQSSGEIALARYDRNGFPDTTFAPNGVMIESFAGLPSPQIPVSATVDAAGKLVVVGFVGDTTTRDGFVARFLADGSLDATFGTDGVMVLDLGHAETFTDVVVLPSGKIVVLGTSQQTFPDHTEASWVLARYDGTGALDTTFGKAGSVLLAFGPPGSFSRANGLAVDPTAGCGVLATGLVAEDAGGFPGVVRILP